MFSLFYKIKYIYIMALDLVNTPVARDCVLKQRDTMDDAELTQLALEIKNEMDLNSKSMSDSIHDDTFITELADEICNDSTCQSWISYTRNDALRNNTLRKPRAAYKKQLSLITYPALTPKSTPAVTPVYPQIDYTQHNDSLIPRPPLSSKHHSSSSIPDFTRTQSIKPGRMDTKQRTLSESDLYHEYAIETKYGFQFVRPNANGSDDHTSL
eukprot:533551_1